MLSYNPPKLILSYFGKVMKIFLKHTLYIPGSRIRPFSKKTVEPVSPRIAFSLSPQHIRVPFYRCPIQRQGLGRQPSLRSSRFCNQRNIDFAPYPGHGLWKTVWACLLILRACRCFGENWGEGNFQTLENSFYENSHPSRPRQRP